MSITAAVVLAAGEGERLRPLTRNRPKPMLPAANRPIIEYVFDALVDVSTSSASESEVGVPGRWSPVMVKNRLES